MCSLWQKRLNNLLCVKSIVTLVLTAVFAYLAIKGQVSAQDFLTVFSIVIAFYFGTQSQSPDDKNGNGAASAEPDNKFHLSDMCPVV